MTVAKKATDPNQSLRAKLIKVISEVPVVHKGSKNTHLKSSYSNIVDVMAALKPILNKHEVAIYQPIHTREDGKMWVDTFFADMDGSTMLLSSVVVKDPPENARNFYHEIGGGVSYIRRYAIMSAFSMVSSDDDRDGNYQVKKVEPPKKKEVPLAERQEKAIEAVKKALGESYKEEMAETLKSTKDVAQLTEVYNALTGK